MWIIYFKELLELMRDRRTIVFTILIPIFAMPLIGGGFAYLSTTMFKQAQSAQLSYAIFGKQEAPQLSARFARDKGFREVQLGDETAIRKAITDERIKFALVIPPRFEATLEAQRQASIALHYNSASTTDLIRKRVMTVVKAQNDSLREQALSSLNLNQTQLRFALTPITLDEHSTADKREQMGALMGGVLPYILLMVCQMAAMYPSIDLGAGEKERGTLETLLLAPVPRGAIVLAKFLVLFSVSLTSALLMVASLGVIMLFFGGAMPGELTLLARSIGAADLAMVALMLVPTAAIFSAILLSISIYAKSYKEATGLISPLLLLTMLPVTVGMLPGVELNWMWSMVPLTNVALAMKELIKGTMDYRMLGVIMLSSTVIAGALLALCRWWFSREQVLFRD
ncbi:sodium transport system permease protein [Oxalobacteraceae bacterium GrIS 1.11]